MSMVTTAAPEVGHQAPLFEGTDHDQRLFHLETHIGDSWVLLWFWPNAPTTGGCGHSLSHCGATFRRNSLWLLEQGVRVIGVNYDDPWTNWLWAGAEDNMPFYLVSDETKEIAALYGAKRPDGADWEDLPLRRAFLIDPEGIIRETWSIFYGVDFVEDVFKTHERLR